MDAKQLKAGAIILILSLTSSILKAQSLSHLDEKRGFKEFKLGDTYSKWYSKIQLIKDDIIQKHYLYNGDCCTYLFDYPVDKIDLIFHNNILVIIEVELKTWDKPNLNNFTDINQSLKKYDDLNNNFKLLFANPSHINNDVAKGESTYSWETKKTVLETKFTYLGASNGSSTDVVIADVDYLQNYIDKGF